MAEAARNVSCVGAKPIAITNCLNFGNPERPHIMGQLVGCIEGMREACLALDYPVVSGNVSLYNETNGIGIPPTPAIGGVGLLEGQLFGDGDEGANALLDLADAVEDGLGELAGGELAAGEEARRREPADAGADINARPLSF